MTPERRPGRWSARAALIGGDAPATRGGRWLCRHQARPAPPSAWDRVTSLPAWVDWAEPERRRLGTIAALIAARPVIDRTLDGARLAPLAALVGEAAFDALCALPVPSDAPGKMAAAPLPAPAACMAHGARLLDAALAAPQPSVVAAVALMHGGGAC